MIKEFWKAVVSQNAEEIRKYFKKEAIIRWHNTNEAFTVEEFIQANCSYPDTWDGEVERIEVLGDLTITVTRVFNKDQSISVHATSFFKIEDEKIVAVDEYWGDDGVAPQWRLDMKLGKKIH